jgi:DNA mismatch endonuclease, patch repair protein
MDVFTKKKRSEVMSKIRCKDTKPEFFVRSALHRLGYRFRLHAPKLPGKPDLVFPKYKALIFVHGCFWHGHECHLFKWPKSREKFWRTKILKNRENDKKVYNALKKSEWRIATIWECAIKGKNRTDPENLIHNVSSWLESNRRSREIKGKADGKKRVW